MNINRPAYPRRKRVSAALGTEDTLVLRTGMDRLFRPVADAAFDDLIARFSEPAGAGAFKQRRLF